jgi:coenzyme F420-reducing hydrogenase alpha subunit
MSDMSIRVHHLTRVEGHGNIVVNVSNGRIEKCEWQVPEAPRFFEAMVRGRHYTEVARVTSRICGICAIGHTLASVKATEAALGMRVTRQTKLLRRLLKHAETFDSHVLHVLFLAAPDLVGVPSVFPLVGTHPEVVRAALRLKRFGHEWGALLAGRTTHPTRVVPGGFAALPTDEELAALAKRLKREVLPDLKAVVELVASLAGRFPAFERPTEYMALWNREEYGLYDGIVQTVTPDGVKQRYALDDYRSCTNEYVVPQSTAKYTRNRLPSYMAGALARLNNNHDQLHPQAKKLAATLGLQPLCFNPYLNTAAQLVEVVHSVHEALRLMDETLTRGIRDEFRVKPTRFGEGVGAVEVPRGILFHRYAYDREGICLGGDCIIPTNQNHGNIQGDFEKLVPELLAARKPEKQVELALEMLVRAYDPCISCSTHYLTVAFVK